MRTFTAYVEWDPETKLYVGIVPGIPGAHTQGATLDELHENLKEVLELCTTPIELSELATRHLDSRATTLPNHGGRDIARTLIREILREIELTPEQFGKELED